MDILTPQGAVQGTTSVLVGIDVLIDGLMTDGGLLLGLEVA
ncbi:MAG TPA: hypothetical protein VIM43_06860 [Rugosibacter sp.]